jgi:hypothetical protein
MAYTSRADLAKAVRSTTEKSADSTSPEKQPGCTDCFKDGWPEGEHTAVGCEHGTWIR